MILRASTKGKDLIKIIRSFILFCKCSGDRFSIFSSTPKKSCISKLAVYKHMHLYLPISTKGLITCAMHELYRGGGIHGDAQPEYLNSIA